MVDTPARPGGPPKTGTIPVSEEVFSRLLSRPILLKIFMAIRSFRDRTNGLCAPSMEAVAQKAGLKKAGTVERRLSELRKAGVLLWGFHHGPRRLRYFIFPLETQPEFKPVDRVKNRAPAGEVRERAAPAGAQPTSDNTYYVTEEKPDESDHLTKNAGRNISQKGNLQGEQKPVKQGSRSPRRKPGALPEETRGPGNPHVTPPAAAPVPCNIRYIIGRCCLRLRAPLQTL